MGSMETTYPVPCLVHSFWTWDLQKHGKSGIWGLTPALFGITLHANWPFKTKETQLPGFFFKESFLKRARLLHLCGCHYRASEDFITIAAIFLAERAESQI